MKGKKKVGGFVTDARTGQVLGLDALVERDSDAFMDWLADCAGEFGVEAIVTDNLNTYKPAVERLGLERQICMAHLLKWVWNRLEKIAGWGWDWFKARIWRLLRELPANGGLDLLRLVRLVRNAEDQSRRRPRAELSGKRRALLCHRRRTDVHWANNAAERAIGGSKIRCKTVRGYKSELGLLNGFGLTQRAWSGSDGLELSELVAAQSPAHPPRGVAPSEIRAKFPNRICDGYLPPRV